LVLFSCKEPIKEPSVAGEFYPAQREELQRIVDGLLSEADDSAPEGRLIALISPHAGYVFSGSVSAQGYRRLRAKDIKTIVVIGASHYHNFKGASVYARGSFRTPLGEIKINKALAERLLNKEEFIEFKPEVFEKEHSVEVQIPFIQRVLPNATIVPIMTGNLPQNTIEYISERLIEAMSKDNSIVLVASTDLSHYYERQTAITLDSNIIDAIRRLSISDIERCLVTGTGQMCSTQAVLIAIRVAKGLGANNSALFKYGDSADASKDISKVVGYASIGLYKSPLTDKDKEELLKIARDSIIEYITKGKLPEVETKNPKLLTDGASFVTIKRNGTLRGCMGNIEAVMPLYKSVARNAISAAVKDPRFPPLTKSEIEDMEIEVSVLSPLSPVKNIDEIRIGIDGLLIVKDQSSALFLPEVPIEQNWDMKTLLKELTFKAGLPEDALNNGALLYKFQTEKATGAVPPP